MDSKKELKVKLLEGFARWLRLPLDKVSWQAIGAHCPRVDDTEKGQQAMRKIISKAKVVLCTLNTAGSSFLRKTLCGKFDTLFLDEAAQVSIYACCMCHYLSMNNVSANFTVLYSCKQISNLCSVRKQSSTLQLHFQGLRGLY